MDEGDCGCAILLVDVVGSMRLYQQKGDNVASSQITGQIDRLRKLIGAAGGGFIKSRGDDVLATFADAQSALNLVIDILNSGAAAATEFHVGLHFGTIVRAEGDIFGDAVNLTARFMATANPGEAIISQEFVDRLPPTARGLVHYLDEMTFKGKSQPQKVYTLATADHSLQTEIAQGEDIHLATGNRYKRALHVTLIHQGKTTTLDETSSVSVGRSPDCDIIIDKQWVSRLHATITLLDGRVHLIERSSSGTFISMQGAQEVFTRREDVLLFGSGEVSPGLKLTSPNAQVIRFTIEY
ncbi:MAG: FHA domain-containing protein [Aestuariivirga sp.]